MNQPELSGRRPPSRLVHLSPRGGREPLHQRWLRLFHSDPLFHNSVYLMLSTGTVSLLGFAFWIVNARLYSTVDIGFATALISVATLIGTFSLLGLNNALIRYLGGEAEKNRLINSACATVALAATAIATVYVLGTWRLPRLAITRVTPAVGALIVAFSVMLALYLLLESIFIAYRSTVFILIKNAAQAVVKLGLTVTLVSFGAFGIVGSFALSLAAALSLSFFFLRRRFRYRPWPGPSVQLLRGLARFSFGTYIGLFLFNLPALALPVVIVQALGPSAAAYFYMSTMMANLLYVVPLATTQSLFAEGSFNPGQLQPQLRKATRLIALLLTPGLLLLVLLGSHILLVFGPAYAAQGAALLQLQGAAAAFAAINMIGAALMSIRKDIRKLVLNNLVGAAATMGLSLALMPAHQLTGVGWAWLLGQAITSALYARDVWVDLSLSWLPRHSVARSPSA
ncbi:MAG TPA: lipopolysaccharide biosynthesis protein [Chloroflexota bacterium]|nr:lipopolysaccharide biosynthesis protein [Chloroflexota bacterium]